jgi:hypothetical protein
MTNETYQEIQRMADRAEIAAALGFLCAGVVPEHLRAQAERIRDQLQARLETPLYEPRETNDASS